MDFVIEAQGLKKTFGPFVAVDGISFGVSRGECFGLLGPNGAGKTSTIRMIYGFSPRTAGSLKIFGLGIDEGLRQIKSRIGVCQQENSLDTELTVLQNLEVFASYFDIEPSSARRRAEDLLKFIALEQRRDAPVIELSGGLMRRLMLARALINNPQLLILDEPTTGLDPQSRHQIWNRLEELRAGGLTILLTTHYMEEASRLCDRLIIMDHGRILVEGKPVDLVRQYAGRDVIEVSEPTDRLRSFISSKGLPHDDLGHRLIIYCDNRDQIYGEISSQYCQEGCILRMATLEDVFLKLTGRELRE
ncbi:MAG: ATP-binding cassette domain-containing protein [Deltaproteobacteria bacterium]|nr:ATP-binding cassette domain-containing protein [Deltaproteobacteria bacterium]